MAIRLESEINFHLEIEDQCLGIPKRHARFVLLLLPPLLLSDGDDAPRSQSNRDSELSLMMTLCFVTRGTEVAFADAMLVFETIADTEE
jgi:hypothetical protein